MEAAFESGAILIRASNVCYSEKTGYVYYYTEKWLAGRPVDWRLWMVSADLQRFIHVGLCG